MPYPNEHAARIRDPGLFIPSSFRTKNLKDGVRIIIGKLKTGGENTVTQAYRFSKDKFTPEEVRQWLKDNNVAFIKFEEASEENMDNELKHYGKLGMRWGSRKGPSTTTVRGKRVPATTTVRGKRVAKLSTRTSAKLKKLERTRKAYKKKIKDYKSDPKNRKQIYDGKMFIAKNVFGPAYRSGMLSTGELWKASKFLADL